MIRAILTDINAQRWTNAVMSMGHSSTPLVLLITVAHMFLSQGCTPKTVPADLPLDPPPAFSETGTVETPDRWWTAFGDDRLNAFVDTVLEQNLNLRSAWQRIRAARAVVDRESASLLPTLDASAQGAISRTQTEFEESQRFRVDLGATYEIDLWGRIRAAVDANRYRAEATIADYQTAAISLSAEVVRNWFQLQEAQGQLRLVEAQIATNAQILRLIRNRFGTGLVRSVDILRQQQLLEASREQRTYVEARIRVLEHQLAVLAGRSPQHGMDTLRDALPELPPMPETGIPVELLQRRPDVQSIYSVLLAADSDLAAAISNQYPRLNLSASLSSSATEIGGLFEGWAASLGGNLLAPIFYGGQLKAEVERSRAVKEELLYTYGQTVLTAFQEVEDALIRELKQRESISSIEQQLDLARQSLEQLRLEFFNGISDYLDVLTALDQEQQLQRDLLSARLALLEYRVALYRALAGGFETGRGNGL